jgi:hypothetical protein
VHGLSCSCLLKFYFACAITLKKRKGASSLGSASPFTEKNEKARSFRGGMNRMLNSDSSVRQCSAQP